MTHYRQGDVLVVRDDTIQTDGLKAHKRDGSRIVLAYGEVTGHAHAIHETTVTSFVDSDGNLVLDAPEGATVVHEEHDTITLPKGRFRVIRQREYTPEKIIQVAD